MLQTRDHASGLTFKIHVQPRSSHNRIVGLHGDALKVKITAPPVEGAANKMCAELIAESLGVSRSSIEIVAGQTARMKQILVRCNPADRPHLRKLIENLARPE
jgi:uncharacterized protein